MLIVGASALILFSMKSPEQNPLAKTAIVLVQPKYPENVGAAARVGANLGVRQIIVVRRQMPDREPMERMATHHARHLIDHIELYPTLTEALAPFGWVLGTSARQGRQRHNIRRLETASREIIPQLTNNPVALVFGPEDRGLTNDDLSLCNMVATIPTVDMASLNLAQAVAIVCWEITARAREELEKGPTPGPKLANSQEREEMYSLLDSSLRAIDYLKENDYNYWMHNLRSLGNRLQLRAREVKFIRGFCRQIIWLSQQKNKK